MTSVNPPKVHTFTHFVSESTVDNGGGRQKRRQHWMCPFVASLASGKRILSKLLKMHDMLEKKSLSKPMRQILTRLEEFEYISTLIFPEEVVLNVSATPTVHNRKGKKSIYMCININDP